MSRELKDTKVLPETERAVRRSWWAQSFWSLRHRDFRYLWLGHVVQSEGQWMEQVARGWLLWELSRDPFILGLYGMLRQLPALALAVPAGILSDRISRVILIQFSQVTACLLAFLFGFMVQTRIINESTVWVVLLFALLNGSSEALRMPARMSLIPNLVPERDLMNAVAVNEVAQYTMRILGPVLAGAMIGPFGVAGVFYVRGGLYLFAVVVTAFIHAPLPPAQARQRSVFQNVGDTLSYLKDSPIILALVLMGVIPAAFGMPYQHLMPIFAKDIFAVGAQGLGVLTAAGGLGALVGAFVLASLGNVRRMGLLLMISLITYGGAIILFGLSPWFVLALLVLLLLGASQAIFMAMRQTLTQLLLVDEMRGRVLSVGQLARGGLAPLGSLQAGIVAGLFGAPVAVMVMGSVLGGVALACTLFLPGVRKLEFKGVMGDRVRAMEQV